MHSLGNDFLVLDCVSSPQEIDANLVRSWSDRKRGIGFDQLLVIAPPTIAHADFDYEIYNQNKEKISIGNSVLAFMDMKTNKPMRCPDYILEKLNI